MKTHLKTTCSYNNLFYSFFCNTVIPPPLPTQQICNVRIESWFSLQLPEVKRTVLDFHLQMLLFRFHVIFCVKLKFEIILSFQGLYLYQVVVLSDYLIEWLFILCIKTLYLLGVVIHYLLQSYILQFGNALCLFNFNGLLLSYLIVFFFNGCMIALFMNILST